MNTKKAIYYPMVESEVPSFYDNAYTKLQAIYAAKYGIAAPTVLKIGTHNTDIPLNIAKAENDRQTAQASTVEKRNELNSGKKDLLAVFNQIVLEPNFEEVDAEDLGMRREKTPVDMSTVKPVISQVTLLPDKIVFDWIRGEMNGLLIDASYDGTNFTFLDKDQKSPFEDFRKNKVVNVAEARYFRFRYIFNDQPVGIYTEVIKVICDIY